MVKIITWTILGPCGHPIVQKFISVWLTALKRNDYFKDDEFVGTYREKGYNLVSRPSIIEEDKAKGFFHNRNHSNSVLTETDEEDSSSGIDSIAGETKKGESKKYIFFCVCS